MANRRRSKLEAESRRLLQPQLLREGTKARRARRRRRWTQAELGRRVDLSQSTISLVERGEGGSLSLQVWQRIAGALDLPLSVELGRDAKEEPTDAGHLAVQELVMRLGRGAGYRRTFELSTKPADPSRSTDVGLLDDLHRRLVLVECVNTFGNVGASVRSSDRKRQEAEALAISIGHGDPFTVHEVWVVRDTRRNRELVARYPELFASRFPGSSSAWVRALNFGSPPPQERGLVWSDARATRLFAWRPRHSR
jgi:transcriptional regulator with XRE-family HTH domain